MAKGERQKLKLIYLIKIFWNKTSPATPMPLKKIIEELNENGISAARKRLYDDIQILRDIGFDIQMNDKYEYYLARHFFEESELKMLMDTVYASPFISNKKAHYLLEKLGLMTNSATRKRLTRNIYARNRIRIHDTDCFAVFNGIIEAIHNNRQISFLYFRLTPDKKAYFYKNGDPYTVSPWELFWRNGYYYLICYREEVDKIEYFRIDRIAEINIISQPRQGKKLFSKQNLQYFLPDGVAGSCNTSPVKIILRCGNIMSSTVMEKFGRDIVMVPDWEGKFTTIISVVPDRDFYSWAFYYSSEVEILSPEGVRSEMRRMLDTASSVYTK